MSKVIILLCAVIVILFFIGTMVKQIFEDVSEIYGALFLNGYLKGADDEQRPNGNE